MKTTTTSGIKRLAFGTFLLFTGIIGVSAQQVIVTDDASYTTPASGAVLDVKSNSKGFMLPRVALASNTDQTTIASPSTGLMVYNTGTVGLPEKGIYMWNGTIWEKGLTGGDGATNYVKIAADGTLTLNGNASTYDDLVVNPYTALNNGATKPNWTKFVETNIYTWEFIDGTSSPELFFMVQLPHNYKEGANIFPHIHWSSPTSMGTNRVKWTLDYQWVNHTGTFTASTSNILSSSTLAGANPDRSVVAYEHIITKLGTISGSGKTVSSILLCRLRRDGADSSQDNFTGSAFMLSFDFHYEIDSFGSKDEYVK